MIGTIYIPTIALCVVFYSIAKFSRIAISAELELCIFFKDDKLVNCVDLLVPHVGELCGGGLRELNANLLDSRYLFLF